MKKRLLKIFSALFVAVMLLTGLTACGKGWDAGNVKLKTITPTVGVQGGFLSETQNYVYFINGVADSTADNTLGTPVKGALYVADKKDLSNVSVVVPKLFAGTDYNAGVYIFGEYVYYATPSTDKNSSGAIANDELAFSRTKLDGTGTEVFFNVKGVSTEYRIIKGTNDEIFAVYYDSADEAIKSYNFNKKETQVVVKKNAKAENESLSEYKFATNDALSEVAVVYTTTVYSEKFDEEASKESSYSRGEKACNRLYAYKVGDGKANDECLGTLAYDGDEAVGVKVAFKNFSGKTLYLTLTRNDEKAKAVYYSVSASEIHNENAKTSLKKISQTTYFDKEGAKLIKDDGTALYMDTDSLQVMTTNVYATDEQVKTETKPLVKLGAAATSFVGVDGDYLYFVNSSTELARIIINNFDNHEGDGALEEQRVSDGKIGTSWFAPRIVSLTGEGEGKTEIFYLDASDKGLSYVSHVSASATVKGEDTDDDGENDLWYLEENAFMGERTDEDKASIISVKINAITSSLSDGKLVFDKNAEGEETSEIAVIDEARKAYDEYKDDKNVIGKVSEDNVKLLEKYEKAKYFSVLLKNLDGFKKLSETDKDAKKSVYNEIKTAFDNFFAEDKSEKHAYYDEVRDLVVKNLMGEYKTAEKYFADKKA